MLSKERAALVSAFFLALVLLCPAKASAAKQDTQTAAVTTIITIDRSSTKEDIAAMARVLLHNGFYYSGKTEYDEAPVFSAPYKAGSLKSEYMSDALDAIKMVRYLAGLPYKDIKLSPELNDISQHGAVLLAATGQMTHSPVKPDKMGDDFFALAYRGCNGANLYRGSANASYAILRFMAEPGGINLGAVAHRRWLLKPGAESFGLGYAEGITSLYVADGLGSYICEADTYVAWPNAGDFPIEYFAGSTNISEAAVSPWSVNLGAAYSAPQRDSITLTLTRTRDSKTWVFDKNTPQLSESNMQDSSMHFAVDNAAYGMSKAIIFRPDVATLGPIQDGDEFTIKIDGIKTSGGASTSLSYTVRFFSLTAELQKQENPKETVYEHKKGEYVKETSVSGAALTVAPVYEIGGKASVVKMSTTTSAAVVFIAPETARYSFTDNKKTFSDTSGHWSAENIDFVTSRELFEGVGGNSFDPDGSMTRAMLVTVLARLYGANEAAYKNSSVFSDVKNSDWFAWAVAWGYENGIIDGVGGNLFAPNALVTREQMAAIIVRYAGFAGFTPKPVNETSLFADDDSIASWSRDSVYALRRADILGGKSGNICDPRGYSTRAEVSAVLRRFIESVLLG